MNNYLDSIDTILAGHTVTTFFNVRIMECEEGKAVLGFRLRDEFHRHSDIAQSTLGCIVDCVARIAGYGLIGPSFISEHEINYRPWQLSGGELIASAQIQFRSDLCLTYVCDLTYDCELLLTETTSSRLVAESQGTLAKLKPQDGFRSKKIIHEATV